MVRKPGLSGAEDSMAKDFSDKRRRGWMARSVAGVVWACALAGCHDFPTDNEPHVAGIDATLEAAFADGLADAKLAQGCTVEIVVESEPALAVFNEVIDSAQHELLVEMLTFDPDAAAGVAELPVEFVEKLAGKVDAGVRVCVIVDALAQTYYSGLEAIDQLRSAGVEVRKFMAPHEDPLLDNLLYRTHKKIVVADGTLAILGGRNLGPWYFTDEEVRDITVRVTGPAVADVQNDFLRDWQTLGDAVVDPYRPELQATGELDVWSVDQRPWAGDYDINAALVAAIRLADERIVMETPYYNPTPWLLDELLAARARGVEIELLTDGPASSDIPNSYEADAYWFKPMVEAGFRIWVWNQPGRLLHTKALVIDDELVMLGSANINFRSLVWDTENVIFVRDAALAAEVTAMVVDDRSADNVYIVDAAWLASQSAETLAYWDFVHWLSFLY
jgi:cardiolipin synthase